MHPYAIDDRIIARARRGEETAWAQIYQRFERPVYTLAVRMLADREEAQDVLHDTMLRLLDRLESYRGESPFWPWLRQIAVNESLMRLRRRGLIEYVDSAPEPDSEATNGACAAPEHVIDQAHLLRAMDGLPAVTRSVLWLYHAEGYTHEEIANLMQRTVSFSKSQLARGTRRLRALIESGTCIRHEVDCHAR